jgi:hypothetical protein
VPHPHPSKPPTKRTEYRLSSDGTALAPRPRMLAGFALTLWLSFSGSTFVPLPAAPAPAQLNVFSQGYARVTGTMMQFRPTPTGAPPTDVDRMDRERRRALNTPGDMLWSQTLGAAMFGAMSALVAHAPGPMRLAFDGNLRVAPALLPDGALGVGFGLRF